MRKRLAFAFLLMGFTFTVMQTIVVRELLVSFSGNELSIGVILGNWLILEALGSGLAGRLKTRGWNRPVSYALLQIFLALVLPLSLYGAMAVRRLVGVLPGEGIGFFGILSRSLLMLIPVGLIDGAMFTFGCEAYGGLGKRDASAAGRVYAYEAMGAIIGGVLFTLLLVTRMSSLRIVLMLVMLNLLSAFLLLGEYRRVSWATALTALAVLASSWLLISPLPRAWYAHMVSQQWPGYFVADYGNSPYGNLVMIQQEQQYTLFSNGTPILTVPVPDVATAEELVHIPMLFHPHPRRVLVLSGGVGGVLREILKYPVERVTYAEMDPMLFKMIHRFSTPLTEEELGDPRVDVRLMDGRLLVRKLAKEAQEGAGMRYDVIYVHLPYPSTLQLNRFYTLEYFRHLNKVLRPGGLVVLDLPGSMTYMGDEMRRLHGTIFWTLTEVFPSVRPVPGDLTLLIASTSSDALEVSNDTLLERWDQRGLPTNMLTDFHLLYRLDEGRETWYLRNLPAMSEVGINRDLKPRGVLYGLAYWNALFSPHMAGYFHRIERVSVWPIALGIAVLMCGLFIAMRWMRESPTIPISTAIITTGFGGMAIDLIVVFAFQALYGYVYQQIGLLIAVFMVGLSAGGLWMTRRTSTLRNPRQALAKLEAVLCGYWVIFPLLLGALFGGRTWPDWEIIAFLLLANLGGGILVGAEFPLATAISFTQKGQVGRTAGSLYAADLVGAFLGSILVSVVLLPTLGIAQTCLLIILLKMGSLILILCWPQRSPELEALD